MRLQQSLRKAQLPNTKFSIERTSSWGYKIKANNRLIGEVPEIVARQFAKAEKHGLWVSLRAVKVIEAPASVADMRSAAFCLFDEDDEEEASEKLTALVAFNVAPRDKQLAP